MLNIHIVTLNNSSTIEDCLESITNYFPKDFYKIIVVDGGSQDDTIEKCLKRNIKVTKTKVEDLSKTRNSVLEGEWQFYIEPWEILTLGHDIIYNTVIKNKDHLRINVIQGDVLNKPIRLWKKSLCLFTGKVYEKIDIQGGEVAGLIVAKQSGINRNKPIIENWCKLCPTNPNAFYFKSMMLLHEGDFRSFIKESQYFHFLTKNINEKKIMIWYYESCVYCYIERNANLALKKISACIACKPRMAEFWCILGDIHYYLLDDYTKASCFYENAIIMGSFRENNDNMAIEISKYNEYPKKMLDSCRQLSNSLITTVT